MDLDEITKLVNSPLKKGESWYLLDKKWYEMCKSYHESGDKTIFPGPIDNSALFEPIPSTGAKASNGFSTNNTTDAKFKLPQADAVSVDSRPLRSDLSEADGHFIVVPEKCWNILKENFGITSANHAIKRKVIEVTPGQMVVEIQPASLKLCLYGGKEATVEKSFSRNTTIDELHDDIRKVFNISEDRETKVWVNNSIFTFKPSEMSPSKSENNLRSTSPTKLPPTPPPMPKYTAPESAVTTTTRVVTRRQVFNDNWNKLTTPDLSTSPNAKSSALSTSTSDSPISSTSGKTNLTTQTLADLGVFESAVVTLEVVNADGTWPSSRPRYGTVSTRSSKAQPGLCGLSNMGNTCFMNAALQCLSNTPPLTNYILTDKFVEDINTSNPLGMHGEIARTYAELIKVLWSGNNTSFLPREFKCAVSRFAPQFTGFAQQDCQELMAFLLDGLHEDLNRIRNKPYIETKNDIERRPDEVVAEESWENYKKRNNSIVVDTFHAMLKSTLVCPGCKLVSVTFDPFCYLSLPLPVKREKQVNMTFFPSPVAKWNNCRVDMSKIETNQQLSESELETIKNFGGSISSSEGTVEDYGGYSDQSNRPLSCKLQVPRSGPVNEICDIVTRIINEERSSQDKKVKQDNLVVAELSVDGRITKIYDSNEHYNQIGSDILVIEKASNYVLPLYLRERKSKNAMIGNVLGKPLFLHVPDLKFNTLYKSTIASLSNITKKSDEQNDENTDNIWVKIDVPNEDSSNDSDKMDCDEDEGNVKNQLNQPEGDENMETEVTEAKTNGNSSTKKGSTQLEGSTGFELCIVNSFGNHSIETLASDQECDYSSKLYLGATFAPETLSSTHQFKHLRQSKYIDTIDTFTPKVSPKPTLQLNDCITEFTNVERLGADDPWYCPKCKKHQQATKKFDIWSLPKVLIIHLKRFSFSRSWRDKIDTLVEFPVENLDMSKYVLNPKQKKSGNLTYNLIGVANHFGGLGGGHYTAFAKNVIQDSWHSFDDAIVTQTSANNVVTRSAYVLFYQLQEENTD